MKERASRILVVDDEPFLADLVGTALRYEGFETELAGSAEQAQSRLRAFNPDLIVLDIMLGDGSGLELCRRLRSERCQAPVVFLTARDTVEDKVRGLTVGGDDYLTKPFSLDELVARIRAVLRRTQPDDRDGGRVVFADLEIDEDAHQVYRHGVPITLSPTEFRLLHYLTVNAGRVISKRQILDNVWEDELSGNDGVIQTYISYLRRKIDAFDPPLIHTVPRIGYVIRMPVPRG
ncbi:response regulator transcription factor [Rhizohabitans arisaemae]|uniref:response regulator transcription factor n=1 Tax=Rhizohabitans arisaemae TaxID=2720610 RepID=UPI0024B122ED|nr:response regulator transcription factor [Rhizohabitans arisaemae]